MKMRINQRNIGIYLNAESNAERNADTDNCARGYLEGGRLRCGPGAKRLYINRTPVEFTKLHDLCL